MIRIPPPLLEITTQKTKNGDLGGKLCWLQGFNPILTGLVAVGIMTFIILALVYGFDKNFLHPFWVPCLESYLQ